MGSKYNKRKSIKGTGKGKKSVKLRSGKRLTAADNNQKDSKHFIGKKKNKLRRLFQFTEKMKENLQNENECVQIVADNFDESNECILIEKSQEIIVIDDDDDGGHQEEKSKHEKNNKTNLSIEEISEIFANIEKKTTPSPGKKTESSVTYISPIKRRSQSKSPSTTLFYEDLSTGLSTVEIPIYNTIKSSNDNVLRISESPRQDDVICIDSSSILIKNNYCNNTKRKRENLDDSVIFVSEQLDLDTFKSNTPPIYIPLTENSIRADSNRKSDESLFGKVLQPFKKFKDHLGSLYTSTPKGKTSSNLFTASEQKKNQLYNANTYNPNKDAQKSPKRMVIIDGSNVAFGHSLNKEFSVKGLEICLEYFQKMGHEVKAVVPQFRLQKNKSSQPDKLEKLHRNGKIVFTPCKNLPGKSTTCYDDRFILQLALEFDAAVVSNDNYRDLIGENPGFKKIIENRVIGYTWCNDMFILPKDPYGRNGPSLSVILNRV